MLHFDEVSNKFEELQDIACSLIEKSDGLGKFTKDNWKKEIGHGITRVITDGDKIAKGAINFSKVSGSLTPKMSKALGVEDESFSATGISSIFHGKNPFTPTIHMNVRYFRLNTGVEWFGGGIDLTPIYIDIEQAKSFHNELKKVCDEFNADFYPEFKKWADDYFFITHRNETRGVGGIFFDRQKPSKKVGFGHWVEFCTKLAKLYPQLYAEIIESTSKRPYNESNETWQRLRWGRYAEFNLVYDRGTKFGLESGGNTESILISLPPEVNWKYNYLPQNGSEEQKIQQLLKKGVDWINYEKE